MTTEITKEKGFTDLALATAISLFYPLERVDRPVNSRKAFFVFKRGDDKLDELVESYWRGELKVDPAAYFNALRIIKARLYGEE